MGKASAEILEIRFVIQPELTQVYFLYRGHGDVPLGVTGWHHKTFPKSTSVLDIIQTHAKGEDDPLLWSMEAPEEG